jgi:hypothetical protein
MAVLCPKAVIPHWQKAADEVGAQVRFVTNYEQPRIIVPKFSRTRLDKKGNKAPTNGAEALAIKAEKKRTFPWGEWIVRGRSYKWTFPKPTLFVVDECHRCKSKSAQNSIFLTAAAAQNIPTLMMSATVAQDPTDMYSIGYSLGLHNGADWLGWQARYGVARGDIAWEFLGNDADLQRMNASLFPGHGHRKTFDQIPGFPETQINLYPVSDDAAASKIEALWQEVEVLEQLREEALEAVVVRLRARQIAELSKVPSLAELVEESVIAGNSVVVFLNFRESITQLQKILKSPSGTIIGDQSPKVREAWINDFQQDIVNILVCQTQAGGVGISLHDTHGVRPRVTYISPPDSARDLIQALGRVRRDGAKSPSIQNILYLRGSVEERVRKAVERKIHNISLLNDGDLDPLF